MVEAMRFRQNKRQVCGESSIPFKAPGKKRLDKEKPREALTDTEFQPEQNEMKEINSHLSQDYVNLLFIMMRRKRDTYTKLHPVEQGRANLSIHINKYWV